MLVVNAAVLHENLRKLAVVDQDAVHLRTLSSQGSCTADVPRPALPACRGIRVAFPVEWRGQQRPGASHAVDCAEAELNQKRSEQKVGTIIHPGRLGVSHLPVRAAQATRQDSSDTSRARAEPAARWLSAL